MNRIIENIGRRFQRRRWWFIAIIGAVICLRLALPWMALWTLNHKLSTPGVYQGHVDGISLALWRGAYSMDGVRLTVDRDGHGPEPLLNCKDLALKLNWKELLHGRLRAQVEADGLTFILSPAAGPEAAPDKPRLDLPPADQPPGAPPAPAAETWQTRVNHLIAFRIDELRIKNGTFRYQDRRRGIDLELTRITFEVYNLVGGADPTAETIPAHFTLQGLTTGLGRLAIEADVRPWVRDLDFAVNFSLRDVDLPSLNPSTQHLDGLAFNSGRFSAFLELSCKNGNVEGVLKPLVHGLDVRRFKNSDNGITKLFWKAVIATGEALLVNDETGSLAARIPLHGHIEGPTTDVWTVIGTLISNAFGSAIMPGFEGFMGADGPHLAN